MKTNAILVMTVAELHLDPRVQNAIVRRMHSVTGIFNAPRVPHLHKRTFLEELAHRFTVADVIDAHNTPIAWSQCQLWLANFRDKVASLGLTKLEWIALPYESAREKFASIGKEKLKKKSALILEPSRKMLVALNNAGSFDDVRGDLQKITIGDLLTVSPKSLRHFKNFQQSFVKVCQRLLEMGFTYEDGAFLQEGTRREFIQHLMRDEGLELDEAKKFADLAHKYGWIGKSSQWDLMT
jgi:hypothetical protein